MGYKDSFTARDYAGTGTREGRLEATGVWGSTSMASDTNLPNCKRDENPVPTRSMDNGSDEIIEGRTGHS